MGKGGLKEPRRFCRVEQWPSPRIPRWNSGSLWLSSRFTVSFSPPISQIPDSLTTLQRPQGQHTLTSTHTRTQFFLIPICQTSFSLLLLLLLGCYSHGMHVCAILFPEFAIFWTLLGIFWPWSSLGPWGTSFILSLVPLSSPLPQQPDCLSVCLSVFCLWIVRLQIVFCVPVLKQSCILDFLIFIGLCVWLDFGDREEGSKEGRKEGGELGLLCRWKNSSAAAGGFGDLQIFCCLLLKFQLPVIIRRSFCSSLPRLLCNLLMMFFFGSFGSWVLTSCGVLVWGIVVVLLRNLQLPFKCKTFNSFGDDGWWGAECTDNSSSSSSSSSCL